MVIIVFSWWGRGVEEFFIEKVKNNGFFYGFYFIFFFRYDSDCLKYL